MKSTESVLKSFYCVKFGPSVMLEGLSSLSNPYFVENTKETLLIDYIYEI